MSWSVDKLCEEVRAAKQRAILTEPNSSDCAMPLRMVIDHLYQAALLVEKMRGLEEQQAEQMAQDIESGFSR